MKHSFYLFPLSLLLAGVACQKEDLTLTESEARITDIVETSAGRNDGDDKDKYPYTLYYTLGATLSDITDVEEWGVYFIQPKVEDPIEFAFKNVSSRETKNLTLDFIADFLHVGDNTSYISFDRKIGLYVKKKDKKGNLKTHYSELKNFSLRYDFPSKPSVEYSNAKIVSVEEVEVDGVKKYQTKYSYDFTVRGAFWIDHLEDVLSRGWTWNEESNYNYGDGTHERTTTMTYSPQDILFSQWTIIHCYDTDQTIESRNWLNISGNPMISKVEVSDYERNI